MRQRLAPVFALGLVAGAPALADQAGETKIHVFKTSGCECCSAWIKYLKKNGFAPTAENMTTGGLVRLKIDKGVPQAAASCHTAEIEGYTIEGHVPAEDIRRLLKEKPDATGLAVPGMPLGSPGMDYGSEKEPYETLLIRKDKTTKVFASHHQP